jgi:nucleoside phosphorylase
LRVFTCGLAGALNPEIKTGEVVFHSADPLLAAALQAAGARNGSFHCAGRIAVTPSEKASLRERTRADVVEMESGVVQEICRRAGVPCATVRAISDEANEPLPFDFNALLTADRRLSAAKLMLAILRSPQRIPALRRLGQNSARAARALSRVLEAVVR